MPNAYAEIRFNLFWVGSYVVFFVLLIATDLMYVNSFPALTDSPIVLYASLTLGLAGIAVREARLRLALVLLCLGTLLGLVSGGTIAMFVFAFEAIFLGSLAGSASIKRGTGYVVIALSLATVVGAGLVSPDLKIILIFAMQAAITYWLPFEWGDNVRKARQLAELEKSRAAVELRRAEQEHQLVRSSERARMASELHDTISGNLSAIALQSQAALAGDDARTRERVLREIRRGSLESLEQMHSMIRLLASDGQEAMSGGMAQLESLVDRARAAGHEISVELGPLPILERVTDAALYRIAAEALTNLIRHAPGAPARLVLARRHDDVWFSVENPLPSAADRHESPVASGGMGLANIRARAEQLGGEVEAGAVDGVWRLRVRLPISSGAEGVATIGSGSRCPAGDPTATAP